MAFVSATLGDLTSQAAGTAVDVSALDGTKLVMVSGTFVGTVAIETSADGVKFAAYASALTAPGKVEITSPCKAVRANCTAYTSGTIECRLSGKDSAPG